MSRNIDMQLRDLIPWIFHLAILRISSSCTISMIFLNASLCSAILLASIGFNLQEDDAKFFEFSKSADDGSPRAGRPSKTCPDVPNEFRVTGCKQKSRLIIPLGLGMLMG